MSNRADAEHFYTVENCRGSSFGPGAPIPYPKGSALYGALEIFAGCKYPITKERFVQLGGVLQDFDDLVKAGRVVQFKR